jgi:hypothetical protein
MGTPAASAIRIGAVKHTKANTVNTGINLNLSFFILILLVNCRIVLDMYRHCDPRFHADTYMPH